ncbi:hydrogen peroxide-inducible genes activator [Paraferrimonas haliotis]|uniref:Transcriptional regulator n=1 Tax=Paraferrimonas haliotis TaxID=2013866 RepID=A0AA37TW88_9GAMM|nr:hydrogen peroxide-inducible genes activator [Paraferrimonas haliotis]GLS84070.1 transcriptional regulator [Paraferrimonas haliotis]
MISLKQLNYALAVEQTRHFKKAAELCHVSQSALSTGVQELENQLGCQIFERDNKQVLVTPLGTKLLRKAREIKLHVDDMGLMAAGESAPLTFPMSMGVIPTIGPYLLPIVLPAIKQEYPQLKLKLVEEQSHRIVEMVRSGELDCAILALPYDTQGLHAFEFWQEDFYLLTHESSSLASSKGVTTEAMDNIELLLLKDGHCLKDHALAACKLSNSSDHYSLSATSLPTLVQMVAGELGATLIPKIALEQVNQQGLPVRTIPVVEPGPHRRFAFVCRLNYAGVDSIQQLMKLCRQALSAGGTYP